jgi:hypothetical protein
MVLSAPPAMDDPKLKQEVPMAVVGIVPCKVSAENGANSTRERLSRKAARYPGGLFYSSRPTVVDGNCC